MSITRLQTLSVALLASACLAAPALAQEATSDDWMILPQPQTVAQQRAAQAEADAWAAAQAKAFPKGPVGKTRADVRAELAQSLHDGSYARIAAEAFAFDAPSVARATRLARARP
jgi:hypothetical protein